MKRLLALLLTGALVGTMLLTGCGASETKEPSRETPARTEAPEEETPENSGTEGEVDISALPEMELELGHPGAASEENHMHFFTVRFQEKVEELSGGNIKINIHPASELGGEREMLEAVQLGVLDLCFTSTGPLGNFVPEVYAFDFPFLFKDYDHAKKVFDGEIGEEYAEKIGGNGIQVIVWAENGIRQIFNSVHPVTCAADMQGIKIRTMENKVHMATFEALGADPTPISTAEIYTSLQQGVVDAVEGAITWLIPAKFYETQKYLTMSNHLYAPAILAMNMDQFNGYAPEVQQVLMKAARWARDEQREYLKTADEKQLEFAETQGVEIVRNEEVDRQSFLDATQGVYEELGKDYQDIIDRIRACEN